MNVSDAGPVDGFTVGGSVDLPFACRHEDGTGDPTVVLKPRAIQSALSRICGVCGTSLVRPIALVGTPEEASSGLFAFPPCHEVCAAQLAQQHEPHAVVRTAAFDLIRPTRRGGPVAFRPTAALEASTSD